jgi:hypothetical protein
MKTDMDNSDAPEIDISMAISLVAGILARPGQQGIVDTRPKILAMLKAQDIAIRDDLEVVVNK